MRLDTPRADLQIIKADLNLLFTSAMAQRLVSPLSVAGACAEGHSSDLRTLR